MCNLLWKQQWWPPAISLSHVSWELIMLPWSSCLSEGARMEPWERVCCLGFHALQLLMQPKAWLGRLNNCLCRWPIFKVSAKIGRKDARSRNSRASRSAQCLERLSSNIKFHLSDTLCSFRNKRTLWIRGSHWGVLFRDCSLLTPSLPCLL